jgi:hydroxypyruvate isomerase
MPRFAASLSMLYTEHAFMDRVAAAAADGFTGVEVQFPYDHPAPELRARLDDHALALVLINTPPGDVHAGERGLAALPGREADFRREFERALAHAEVLGAERLHVMAGCMQAGTPREAHHATFVSNLDWALTTMAGRGPLLVIEPINPRDMPGYFLNRQADAHAICAALGSARIKVQMDLYHCQVVEGDLEMKLRQYIDGIGHIQVAGVPQRHEPHLGEVNFAYLFRLIDDLGYDGWVGAEYRPLAGTRAGLGWRAY